VIDDGEAVHINVTLRDAASAPHFTDVEAEHAVQAEVDRAQALHDRKFEFLGSHAPKFNRDNAEFLARERLANVARTSAAANLRDAAKRFRNAV
jgi:hypothetical protein